ncbi:hypothetical protein [Neorhizobium tomejilense]|uniref:hypothetical protein n=1 Tax=Neorhizobium tomejilense TaxID=2093828 RepID=UPI00155F45E3|nr:hypothetical protein [Neorhizobium tomejilense]
MSKQRRRLLIVFADEISRSMMEFSGHAFNVDDAFSWHSDAAPSTRWLGSRLSIEASNVQFWALCDAVTPAAGLKNSPF